MRLRLLALVAPLAAVCQLAAPAQGQTLADVQQELRDALRDSQFASFFGGLVFLSDELELSSARLDLDDTGRTAITAHAFPVRRLLHPWGPGGRALQLEAVVGYASAEQRLGDLYDGMVPGAETSIATEWSTLGAMVGLGPRYELRDDLALTPMLGVGVARIENDTDYGGPGAGLSQSIFDGILFNWTGWTFTAGGATRVDWNRPLGERHELELVGRYDLRWTETIDSDDRAQRFRTRLQLLTLHAEVSGPTGLKLGRHPLGWGASAGYRRATEGDLFGLQDYFLVTGSLELEAAEHLPLGRAVTVEGGVFLGEDVSGYLIGVGLSF